MVLDEPTALLVQSVLTAAADKTVLWITRQSDELSSFDHIATIDHGRFRSQVYEVGVVAFAPSGAFLVAISMIDRRSARGQDQARHGQPITREGIPRWP